MQKWEYNLLVQSPNTECARCEEALNGLGRDGWELVTFYVNSAGDNVFVLKKPKDNKGMAADGSALFGLIERNENMETFCGWIDCYASYAGNYMPPGWANLLAGGIDQPLPSSVTLCPEHARALRAQLKNHAQKIDQMSQS